MALRVLLLGPAAVKAEVQRLRQRRVRVLAVHVAMAGVPPSLRRQTLDFLQALAGGEVHVVKGAEVPEALVQAVQAAAAARRLDQGAKAVLDLAQIEKARGP